MKMLEQRLTLKGFSKIVDRMGKKIGTLLLLMVLMGSVEAQNYPQGYFRHPLNIPLQLVANFGEIRANHWHMGLDIRTQQRVNLPVYAAADGYIARIKVEPGGFGQAIYINHPNGYTTLYAHLNKFFPELEDFVTSQQYKQQTWAIDLECPPGQFLVKKGDFIALSGSTGGSAGPHVHFEIRDTKADKVLNPLRFGFPLPDNVPPSVTRIALYDRNKSTYLQSPKVYSVASVRGQTLKVGSDKVSFAIGATDRIGGSNNGIYAAKISMDGKPVSSFTLDRISYDDTRYINAQIDYPYKTKGGASLQHITPLPGATDIAYHTFNGDGVLSLRDQEPHDVLIEVEDAAGNTTRIPFTLQYNGAPVDPASHTAELFLPNNVNVFERGDFQLITTEQTLYDTVDVSFSVGSNGASGAVSPLYTFL
ncbi:MAG TPA: M23 family metallopeptidase, partial [Flavisolibacter sp.]|nr:M23 family metallopeptidase [Flavisolibacter sp.]